MVNRDDIIRQGFIDVKVSVAGIRQSHRLEVSMVDTAVGTVPFLISKHYIPSTELIRLAEAIGLPIKHKTTVVFPKGKSPSDFAIRKAPLATVESDTVEAEIEEE